MSCIYQITVAGEKYIGSTNDYNERQREHKKKCFNETSKAYYNKVYKAIRQNGGEYKIESIYTLHDDENNRVVERYYYDLLQPTLNMIKPYTSPEEKKEYLKQYDIMRSGRRTEYHTELYSKKRIEKLQYAKERYKTLNKTSITCACGSIISSVSLKGHLKSKKHQLFISQSL